MGVYDESWGRNLLLRSNRVNRFRGAALEKKRGPKRPGSVGCTDLGIASLAA